MIEILNEDLWGKVIAESVAAVNSNRGITIWEQTRAVNAIAKAATRIERSGAFMDYDREKDKLLIWSDSNEIYEVPASNTCQCKASFNGYICWHKAAKRLLSRYFLAFELEERIEHLQSEGWTRAGAIESLGAA